MLDRSLYIIFLLAYRKCSEAIKAAIQGRLLPYLIVLFFFKDNFSLLFFYHRLETSTSKVK